jgi:hypothetical protein
METALADATVAPDPIDNVEATHHHASSCRECNLGRWREAPLCPFLPFLRERLEAPDTVRTLANRHGIPIGDGSLYAG